MNYKFFISLFLLVAVSCKKETPEQVVPVVIAPCSINEAVFDIDSVYYGPSLTQPEAKYRVKFMDTSINGSVSHYIEYGFNKIPTSGKYNFLDKIDTNNVNIVNQIAFVRDSGSYLWRSNFAEYAEVYFEKNNQELIISYCNLADTNVYFNIIDQCYNGNKPISFKVRKQF